MSEQELIVIGSDQLNKMRNKLKSSLEALNREDVPKKIRDAVQLTIHDLEANPWDDIAKSAILYQKALEISHTLDFLRLAMQQRASFVHYQNRGWFANLIRRIFPRLFRLNQPQPDMTEQLSQIEQLIEDCYQPFKQFLVGQPNGQNSTLILPDQILAVYFQGEYLSRPDQPVPFLIVPNFFEGSGQEGWVGVAHETGHHIYRQVPGLREEIEVTVGRVLRNSPVASKESQQRLWFNYLEETFADLIGILTLGSAFVYEQHVIIRNNVPHDELLGKGKMVLTHPIPLVRGHMGVYIYEKLLSAGSANADTTDLNALKQEWDQITNNLADKTLRDPHTPVSQFLTDSWNNTGMLDFEETIAVMKLVVDTLLNSKLQSLRCHSLGELFDFSSDERGRLAAWRQLTSGQLLPWSKAEARIQVAARWLSLHKRQRAG